MKKEKKKDNLVKEKIKEKDVEKEESKCSCGCGDECNCGDNCDCDCDCGNDCRPEEIEILEHKVQDLEEKLRYSKAELINYRKRKAEEVSNMLKFANQDLILELLPVVDNFERAIKLADKSNTELTKFLDGFNMLYVAIKDIFKKFGVEEISDVDVLFDPNYHQAVLVEENKEKENDTVLEILLKGYILKGRVIRPASVKVNKIN